MGGLGVGNGLKDRQREGLRERIKRKEERSRPVSSQRKFFFFLLTIVVMVFADH